MIISWKYFTKMKHFRLSLVILFVIVDLVLSKQQAYDRAEDYDDLRVSSHQFQGIPQNYHSILVGGDEPSPQRKSSRTSVPPLITNHIGKPLVELPGVISVAKGKDELRDRPDDMARSYYHTTRAPAINHWALLNQHPNQQTSNQQIAQRFSSKRKESTNGIRLKAAPKLHAGRCGWMSLREFQNISLETSDINIRDANGQPCYIFSLKAYIQWNETKYSPLSNFRSLPVASKLVLDAPSGGASSERLPLNCLLAATPNTSTTNVFTPLHRVWRSFREELVLFNECGYLVLNISAHGLYLSLDSLAFYQNDDEPVTAKANHRGEVAKIILHQMRAEHLVFSTEGTHNSPLLKMPLQGRYLCQNRVLLTGNNSVQLVLDRFELQRLSIPFMTVTSKEHAEHVSIAASSGNAKEAKSAEDERISRAKLNFAGKQAGSDAEVQKTMRVPLMQRFSSSLVITCPNPSPPTMPLNFMMDFGQLRNNDTSRRIHAENWHHQATSSGVQRVKFSISEIYILSYFFVTFMIANIYIDVDHHGLIQ